MADIHFYATQGDIQSVAQQLANGVSIEYTDDLNSYTPLICAARSEDAGSDMIRFLMKNGADVNAIEQGESEDILGENVLSCALESGNMAKTQILLGAGADVQYKRKDGYDALIDAMYGQNISQTKDLISLLKILIQRGADPTGVSSYGESALLVASSRGRFDAVSLLLEAGADVTLLKWTELMFAVVLGELEEVGTLVAADGELSPNDHLGRTAWLLSLHMGDLSKAQLLLRSGAYRDDADRAGKTALTYAIESGNKELVAWLIDEGVDLKAADEDDETPLMVAAEQSASELVALLLANGSAVNSVQEYEGTALMYAARANAVDCVRILLDHGADPSIAPDEFSSVIGKTSSLEIARMLLADGADLSDINDDVWRCLTLVGRELPQCTREQYTAAHGRQFGKTNPEVMNIDFWEAMVRWGASGWSARKRYETPDVSSHPGPVWCRYRYGRTITELPDGKIIEIGGEHEDSYDPDFCIYNDVIVYPGDGTITILGYPQDVFPPTDFHSATLVGDYIYIIGNTGYMHERSYGETPVYQLCCKTYQITQVETTGIKPGWISRHEASYQEPNSIVISGGSIFERKGDQVGYIANTKYYSLDLLTFRWKEVEIP